MVEADRVTDMLPYAADEMVLEAAVNGRADVLVTFNLRDFAAAKRFDVDVLFPRDALARIKP